MNQFAFTDDLISLPVEVSDESTKESASEGLVRFDSASFTLSEVAAAKPS